MSKRKPRNGEYTCHCNAYKFPHRFSGGRCSGRWVVAKVWLLYHGSGPCDVCNCCSDGVCQVIEGVEDPSQGDCFQEFVNYHEIKT